MKRRCVFGFLALVTLFAGCIHQPLVKHGEVLVYNRAYDFTFLGILKALDDTYPWVLSNTNKDEGVIVAFNNQYWDVMDADKREAVILVKPLGRRQTSVSLAPESQNVVGVGAILTAIDKQLGAYKN